ncbi:MAG: hypothetical protein FWG37_05590, partial [Clostridia bacterium]|nr:hypothetical protein [Clostridia bacterium]
MKRPLRGFAVYAVILIALVIFSQIFSLLSAPQNTTISYDELLKLVEDGKIRQIAIMNSQLVGRLKETSIAEKDFPARYDFDI